MTSSQYDQTASDRWWLNAPLAPEQPKPAGLPATGNWQETAPLANQSAQPQKQPRLTPVDHDPFSASLGQTYRLVPVDHDPFQSPLDRENAVEDAMVPRAAIPAPQPPQSRLGDSLKPIFGGHNPIAETADLVWPTISPEDQAFRDSRGLGERVIDTANFAASAPVRMVTGGQHGLGDVIAPVLPGTAASIEKSEQDFARANAPMLNTIGAVGEVAAAFPPGMSHAATYPTQAARGTPAPVPYTARLPERAVAAAEDLAAHERQGVRPFGAAFGQGPIAAAAKQLSETPIIGSPVRNALEESHAGLRDRVLAVADELAPNVTHEQAGSRMQSALNRFATAPLTRIDPPQLDAINIPAYGTEQVGRTVTPGAEASAGAAAPIRARIGADMTETARGVPVPSDPGVAARIVRRSAEDLTEDELFRLNNTPSAETSLEARTEGLYERAWRMVPDMDRVDGTRNPNVVALNNTRAVLNQIDNEISNQIGGQGTLTGDLADRIRNARSGNMDVEDIRAIRTEIGRQLREDNPMVRTLRGGQLKRLYGALSEDMANGMKTLADRAAERVGSNQLNAVPEDIARRAGGAERAFREADRFTRMTRSAMEYVGQLVNARSPEEVARAAVRSAYDGDRGNARRFRIAMSAMRPEERGMFSSLVLRELGTPVASARGLTQELQFSPTTFITNWTKMSPEAQALLFGGEHRAAIQDLAQIASRLSNVEALSNTSRTATNSIGIGTLTAGTGAMLTGGWPMLLNTIAVPAVMSVLLSRPQYARWAARYAQIKAHALRSPQSARVALHDHLQALKNMAQFDPQLAAIAAEIASRDEAQ